MSHQHRTVVVSGSASGIGRAVAENLRAAGDTVIGIDRADAEITCDLATREGRRAAIEQARAMAQGRLDALVLCAGVSDHPNAVEINYFGTVELAEGLRDLLTESPAPRVAVVASAVAGTQVTDEALVEACLSGDLDAALVEAQRVRDEHHQYLLYPASKRALVRWVRRECITEQWAGAGIPLNSVAPGVVLTAMTKPLLDDPVMVEAMGMAMPMPLNGHADPAAVAALLMWLVSAENTHVTGQMIFVDGGVDASLRGDDVLSGKEQR